MMTIRTHCRMCGSTELEKFLDLGSHALANSFVAPHRASELEDCFPLEVYFCRNCHLAQLVHVVDKSTLFRDYIYFSSGMPKLSAHFSQYAEDVASRFLSPGDFVMELGSNDGILLSWFRDHGYKVLGVDPAENIAVVANERGIPTIADFFSEALAEEILRDHGQPRTILANNVVAHIDDHEGLFRGVAKLLAPDGVFVFEAPYLVDMFENLTYDTVYHEHLSYLVVRPFLTFLTQFGLEPFDAMIVPSQGQSLRLFIGHIGAHQKTGAVAELARREEALGLGTATTYHALAAKVEASRTKLKKLLASLKLEGKRIAAYGAPAKGNTILNYCGIGEETLEFALEDLPSKHHLLAPGTHVRVVPRDVAEANLPDYYLLLAWNYQNVILEREKVFRARGGKFIIPVQGVVVV